MGALSHTHTHTHMRTALRRAARNERGESLVESIVAFLVITVSMLGFVAMVVAGLNLTSQAAVIDNQAPTAYTQAIVTSGTATATYEVAE